MNRFATPALALGLTVLGLTVASIALGDEPTPGIITLLEDNAAELLPQLTNPGGDLGEAQIETDVTFSGASSVKVTHYQRYCNLIPGWAYTVAEKPKEGEYRYLRFAWKADGSRGMMVQLHDKTDWHIRYTAGVNEFGWASQLLSDSPPAEWQLVTVDLFKDFGEREIHGIALTTFNAGAGYFDHIYLGRSVEALDAIDATGMAARGPIKHTAENVDVYWKQLGSADAAIAYKAFWTLAAGDESTREVLFAKLGGKVEDTDAAQISKWIVQLDDDEFDVRERATAELAKHIDIARKPMEAELARTTAPEVRARLAAILMAARQELTQMQLVEQKAKRIVQIIKDRATK